MDIKDIEEVKEVKEVKEVEEVNEVETNEDLQIKNDALLKVFEEVKKELNELKNENKKLKQNTQEMLLRVNSQTQEKPIDLFSGFGKYK